MTNHSRERYSMEAQEFYLVSSSAPGMAIQAGRFAGDPVTLQTKNIGNPLQLWVMQPKISNGSQGVAFVNPATGLSATYAGESADVVMQLFQPHSANVDAWLVTAGNAGSIRITYVRDARWTWQDWGGRFLPGDRIVTYHDTARNSDWTLQPIQRFTSEDTAARPEVVAEPAGATA